MNGSSSAAAQSQPQPQMNGGSPTATLRPRRWNHRGADWQYRHPATSIPGVLLANNEPGQQTAHGTVVGHFARRKRDVQLDGGTKM